jgi:hypothetical protein
MTRITLGHHVGRFEDFDIQLRAVEARGSALAKNTWAGTAATLFQFNSKRFLLTSAGNLSDRKGLVEGFVSANDRSIRSQHEVDTRIRDQVGLELGNIHIQGTIESKGGSEGTNDLGNQTIQVGVSRLLDVQMTSADIIQSLVIQAESTIRVFQEGMGGKNRVVRLDHSSGNLWTGRDSKGELGFSAVINGETFQEERSKTGTSTSSSSMEDKETLKTSTVVRQLADAVQDKVNNFLANGVVSTGVVVGSVFLSGNDLFRVVELGVLSGTDFITNSGFQIYKHSTRDMLSRGSFTKEGVERVISASNGGIVRHITIGGDAMFQAVQLPAVVTDLDTGLSEMDGDTLYRKTKNQKSKTKG